MAEVKLLINTKQAQQALKNINAQVTELKVNGASVQLGGQQIKAQLDQAAKGMKELGNQSKKATEAGDKGTRGFLRSLGSLPGKMKQGAAAAKLFYNAMFSTWTKILIAVQLAIKTFTYFFNNLTESIPKVVAKAQNLVSITQTQTREYKKEKQVADQYVKTLQNLASKESLTSSQQLLAQAIIEKLSERYKGLKITIDQVTGAIEGYTEAASLMSQQDKQQQLVLARRRQLAQKQLVNAQLAKTFGTGDVAIGKQITGEQFFTNAENWFGELSDKARQNIARRWSQAKTGEDYRKIISDLATTYQNNDQVLSKINEVLTAMDKWVQSQKEVNSLTDAGSIIIANGTKNAEKNKEINEDILQTQEKTEEVLKSIADTQQEEEYKALQTNEQKIQWLEKKLDALRQDASDLQQQIQNTEIDVVNKTNIQEANKSVVDDIKLKMDQASSSTKDLNEQMDRLTRKYSRLTNGPVSDNWLTPQNIDNIKNKISELNKLIQMQKDSPYKNDQLIGQRDDLQKSLGVINRVLQITKQIEKNNQKQDELRKQLNSNLEQGNKAEKETLKTKVELAKTEKERADLLKQIASYEEKLKDVTKADADQKETQAQSINDLYSNYENQIQSYNKSARQIAIETALVNAQKAKGAELTREEVDQITFYVNKIQDLLELEEQRRKRQREEQGINNVFEGYQNSQAVQYLKLIGAQKQALYLEALINAERAKGAALTEQQIESVKKYVDIQMMMQDVAGNITASLNTTGIITNELARKGGFASSVVTDRAQDVNAQLLSQAKKQTDLTADLKSEMEQNNSILKYGLYIQ